MKSTPLPHPPQCAALLAAQRPSGRKTAFDQRVNYTREACSSLKERTCFQHSTRCWSRSSEILPPTLLQLCCCRGWVWWPGMFSVERKLVSCGRKQFEVSLGQQMMHYCGCKGTDAACWNSQVCCGVEVMLSRFWGTRSVHQHRTTSRLNRWVEEDLHLTLTLRSEPCSPAVARLLEDPACCVFTDGRLRATAVLEWFFRAGFWVTVALLSPQNQSGHSPLTSGINEPCRILLLTDADILERHVSKVLRTIFTRLVSRSPPVAPCGRQRVRYVHVKFLNYIAWLN